MPLQSSPKFNPTEYRRFPIESPGIGGLNLHDLVFEQETNQSPYMLNMMYKNGSFCKRYGQEYYKTFDDTVYEAIIFNDSLFVHAGTKLYKDDVEIEGVALPESKGMFAKFYQALYYIASDQTYYQYAKEDGEYTWKEVEPYIPTLFNGAEPGEVKKTAEEGESGFGGYAQDEYNLLSLKAIESYNGDGSSKVFYIKGTYEYYDWTITPTIKISDVETTAFTMDSSKGTITFTTAPADGYDNVEITWTLKESALKQDRDRLLGSKYSISFGTSNNTRLFLAGGGDSKYFYSESYDATYFPEPNWEIIGSKEEDITGFGLQYNTLFVFMPHELYSIGSYTTSYYNSDTEESETSSYFASQLVNSQVGCDAPYTIQLIDNKLTWFSSDHGICTLVSSNILDERNIRVISRNVERTNEFGVKGVLDYDEDLNTLQSIDYDNKYFLVFPESGMCFIWDYKISPYYYTSSKETDVKILDFFLFDNFHVGQFIMVGLDLAYIIKDGTKMALLNDELNDFDEPINAYYMSPYLSFNAPDYLKSIKNMYVQCNIDNPTKVSITYLSNEEPNGTEDKEPIYVYSSLWKNFSWSTFGYQKINIAKTFRRKCAIKKVELMAVKFENNILDSDMAISFLGFDYILVKRIK